MDGESFYVLMPLNLVITIPSHTSPKQFVSPNFVLPDDIHVFVVFFTVSGRVFSDIVGGSVPINGAHGILSETGKQVITGTQVRFQKWWHNTNDFFVVSEIDQSLVFI